MKYQYLFAATAAVVALSAAPSQAAKLLSAGTATFAVLDVPTVNLGNIKNKKHTDKVTFNAQTFTSSGTKSLKKSSKGPGVINGTIEFSQTPGFEIDLKKAVENFLVFDDGIVGGPHGVGQYHFSYNSVTTTTFSLNEVKNGSDAISLVLGGVLWDVAGDGKIRFAPTDTTLTLSFNRSFDKFGKASEWSPSVSLAVASDAGAVPEPASWAMMLGGFGAMGAMMRAGRRRNSAKVIFG